ncbi:MAG: hypothetical protein NTY08_08190 [Proteobacteria bacterium]|jgi:hypothetical protein|nr:hypothetical protein [Pseudomonadota bacterium]
MSQDHTPDLIRIATYPNYEDAATARSFLLHRGVTGVVVEDKSSTIEDEADLSFAEGLFDLLVPALDSPKGIVLLAEEWRLEEGAESDFTDESSEELGAP